MQRVSPAVVQSVADGSNLSIPYPHVPVNKYRRCPSFRTSETKRYFFRIRSYRSSTVGNLLEHRIRDLSFGKVDKIARLPSIHCWDTFLRINNEAIVRLSREVPFICESLRM